MTTARPTIAPFRLLLAACAALLGLAWASAADKLPPKYPLSTPPLKLLDELAKVDPKIAAPEGAERELLQKVWDQRAKSGKAVKLTDPELVDLFLIAGGVTDPADLKKYRRKVADLRAKCEREFEDDDEPADRGEKVVKAVHAAMPKGYKAGQTSISVAFDTKQFNCVSASALIYLVGTRYDLDLRPMIVPPTPDKPGHAFLVWVSGPDEERAVVECTAPNGFDLLEPLSPARRKKEVAEMGYDRGRETDGAGLAGGIYYNRGVKEIGKVFADRPEMIRDLLCALALDPADADAAKFVVEALGQRASEVAAEGDTEAGVAMVRLAQAMAPDAKVLRPFAQKVWLLHLTKAYTAGDDAEVVRRAEEAAASLPADPLFKTPAAFFAWYATQQAGKNRWEAGAEAFDRGLKAVDGEPREWLQAEQEKYARRMADKRKAIPTPSR